HRHPFAQRPSSPRSVHARRYPAAQLRGSRVARSLCLEERAKLELLLVLCMTGRAGFEMCLDLLDVQSVKLVVEVAVQQFQCSGAVHLKPPRARAEAAFAAALEHAPGATSQCRSGRSRSLRSPCRTDLRAL